MNFTPIASSSAGNAYLLDSEGLPSLLIDAGVSMAEIQKASGFQVSSLAGALISHGHGDHFKAAHALMKYGVNVYAARETWGTTRHHRAKTLEPALEHQIKGWTVKPFLVPHDCPGTMAFIVADNLGGKLLYMTDSAYSPNTFKGLTHLAIECNWSEAIMRANAESGAISAERYKRTTRTHMSLERLIVMLKANDLTSVKEIHLIHLSDQNSDEAMFKKTVQEATGKPVYIAAKRSEVLK
ncbi:MAG: MBL fold metallo-hydrolase [Chthonomonas sp.]|nr:MBL fold metallo-hydrolase [Chthonomonas sp.]